ncbi:MAG TPA: hypothetical protein VKT81_08865, partial [Bryobacteraceae bacterium]|nr:hypothetical protein [Bryobacteraceae bacterium]
GVEASPYYNEIRNGLGALLINSQREAEPIAIHYSQASFRTDWMLRRQPNGDAWVSRSPSQERSDNDFLRLRESYCRLLEDLGLQYRFVSYSQVEEGELSRGAYRVLILPDSLALSVKEAAEISDFAARGGTVIASGEAGTFDEHSRKLSGSQLRAIEKQFVRLPGDVLNYHRDRLLGKEGPVLEAARKTLDSAGLKPNYRVTDQQGAAVVGVETHVFHNGGATIVGLLSNPQLRVDELGPPEFKSNERFEKVRQLRLSAPNEWYVYDARKGVLLGKRKEVELTLDPYEPAIFAFLPIAAGSARLEMSRTVERGSTLDVGFAADSTAAAGVFHVDVTDAAGKSVQHYSGNFFGVEGRSGMRIPFAMNDTPGTWQVQVRELLTGSTARGSIEVR